MTNSYNKLKFYNIKVIYIKYIKVANNITEKGSAITPCKYSNNQYY